MTDWIDPRYADLVKALRDVRQTRLAPTADQRATVPYRGFLVAEPDES